MPATPVISKSQSQVNTFDGGLAQRDSQIVGLLDGGYLVVWEDHSHVHNPAGSAIAGQRFNSAGEKVGSELFISSQFASGDQLQPAVTRLSNGSIAVAYVDLNGGEQNIYASVFDLSMSFLIRVDDIDVGGFQTYNPALTALANGSYAISYTAGSGADTDILEAVVTATGSVFGSFVIDNDTDKRDFSQLATLANGNFVAVYQDEFNGSSTNTDIKFTFWTGCRL